MVNKWLPEELKLFIKIYPTTDKNTLLVVFPRHTYSSIKAKAIELRLKKKEIPSNFKAINEDQLLREVSKRGFITSRKEIKRDVNYKFPALLKPFKLGIVADSHLCSCYQQLTFLNDFYHTCHEEKITDILHAGDMMEGNGKLYLGQIYEMFLHGGDAIIDYTIKNYPKIEGITTHAIMGNHEYSWFKSEGIDMMKRVADKRPDIKYLGIFGAYINFGNIKIHLFHGIGGVAYARSYKIQKIIEQISPQDKPNILVAGGWHIGVHIPMYRNVEGFSLPCFQSQTPSYMQPKGIYPTIGGLILEIFPNEKGIDHIKTDWREYFVPIKNDY
jgi:predicted phosphodiesterase